MVWCLPGAVIRAPNLTAGILMHIANESLLAVIGLCFIWSLVFACMFLRSTEGKNGHYFPF
jgi:hypothetical protein